jgi:multidrug efflux pump subunit AcrA (membrane-fusion protein)
MFSKIYKTIVSHKIISIIAVLIIIGGGYYWYSNSQSGVTITKYVIEKATQGTVTASVTGSGQTQVVTQIDIKPQVTETVTKVSVGVGDHVTAGQLLITLDTTNEEKSLEQSKLSLQSAQLALAKLQEAPTTVSLGQSQDAVTMAQENFSTASTTLERDYQSGLNTIGSTFVDFQSVMTGLEDFVGGTEINKSQSNPDAYVNIMPNYLQANALPYRNDVNAHYAAAEAAYTRNLADYHVTGRSASEATLDNLFSETYATTKLINETVASAKAMLNFIINNYPTNIGLAPLPAITNTFQTNLGNYTNTTNSDVSNLSDAISTITSDKTSINNDMLSLNEASDSLAQLLAGADPLSIQSQQLSIQQSELSVQNAQQQVDDCYITAPISGVVSVMDAVVGESVASPAASIVGDGQIAEITLNEVDAAKIAMGDPATLTFDAINGLSLAGKIVEIDPVGTVSQGVVNYNVKVGFTDTTNRIKPGMSVTAIIVTKADQNVIAIPNSAIKTQGSVSYVLAPSGVMADADISASANGGIVLPAVPKQVVVTVGLSNDSMTEITSGLQAGDPFIVQTLTTAANSASVGSSASGASSVSSLGRLLGGAGGGGFGGGAAARPATTGGTTGR